MCPDPCIAPIFVLGAHRSGTTWLANELGRHPRIYAVTRRPDFVAESAWFSFVDGRFGRLDDPANRRALIRALGLTVYWRRAGISLEQIEQSGFTTYAAVFRDLMEALARRHGRSRWLEKTPMHTMCAGQLARLFPDAQFVGIRRDPVDRVASAARMYRSAPAVRADRRMMLLESVKTGVYDSVLREFAARNSRCLVVAYETLRRRRVETLGAVLRFLQLEETVEPEPIPGAPSSFSDAREKRGYLSPHERAVVRTLCRVLAAVPGCLHRRLYGTWLRLHRVGDPGGFWAERPSEQPGQQR